MKPKPSTLNSRYKLHTESTGKSSSLNPKPTINSHFGFGLCQRFQSCTSKVVPRKGFSDMA